MGEGAVRRRSIPTKFGNKNTKDRDILNWAREQLNGQEPDLNKATINNIKSGLITVILLRPKKKGFFLPDGSFIEALTHSPEFGDDLDEAEKKWQDELRYNKWADEENKIFNKEIVHQSKEIGKLLWEHGKRITEYAKQRNISTAFLLRLLDERKDAKGYSRHTHQTSYDFYMWLSASNDQDDIFNWTWERIDAIIRFSNNNDVRNILKSIIQETDIGELTDSEITKILGIKKREHDVIFSDEQESACIEFRETLKNMEHPTKEIVNIILKYSTKNI